MAKYSKTSLREQIEFFKKEFDKLCKGSKLNSETKMLIKGMLMLIDLMVSIFLEKQLKKTAKNSSLAPSQTIKDESGLGDKGAKGKGKTETNATASNTRTVENITTIEVDLCPVCGYDLSTTAC